MAGDEKVTTGTLMNVSALEELRIWEFRSGNGSLEDLKMSFLLFLNIRQFYFSYVGLPEGNLT